MAKRKINCKVCDKKVYKRPCLVKKFKNFFCGRECQIAFLKSRAFRKNCEVCNKIFFCQPSQIRYRNRKCCSRKCGDVIRRRMAEKRRIELGYTKHQIDRILRYSPEASRWREAVFKRDDWTCQECGIRGGTRLEADHIKPWAYFPGLRFELSNGRTLCRRCHDKTKMSYKKMREIYGQEENHHTLNQISRQAI